MTAVVLLGNKNVGACAAMPCCVGLSVAGHQLSAWDEMGNRDVGDRYSSGGVPYRRCSSSITAQASPSTLMNGN